MREKIDYFCGKSNNKTLNESCHQGFVTKKAVTNSQLITKKEKPEENSVENTRKKG